MTSLSGPDWFVVLQSAGIIGSLGLASYAAFRETRSRKLGNYLTLIAYHRDVWRMTMDMKELRHVADRTEELEGRSPNAMEAQFLTFVFLHIACSYELARRNELIEIAQVDYDLREFMKGPLVKAFWDQNKIYYGTGFRKFVDRAVAGRSALG